jgi:hypothetical protein
VVLVRRDEIVMHVYRRTRHGDEWLYTVGYFQPVNYFASGEMGTRVVSTNYEWVPLEDTSREEEARQLVNYLNGGDGSRFSYGQDK